MPELGKNLAIILEHLDDRKFAVEADPRSPGGQGYTGLEALLQYVFDQTLATNAHDGNTHLLTALAFEGECADYADIKRAKEVGEHCSTALGPNAVGITFPDATAPKGYDGADRGGPEDRAADLPVPIPLPRRRADRRDTPQAETKAEAQRDAQKDDGKPRTPDLPKPKLPDVPRPKLPDVPTPQVPSLPSPSLPSAPKAPDVPRVETPRVDASPTRENQDAQKGLLDYLLGS